MARFYPVRSACDSSTNTNYFGQHHQFMDSRGIPDRTRHRFARQCFSLFPAVIDTRRWLDHFIAWFGSIGTRAPATPTCLELMA